VDGRLGLAGFMALMKDDMLDAREVLAFSSSHRKHDMILLFYCFTA
jgi:hypothetical protein